MACPFCAVFHETPVDEFDYFKHPAKKDDLRKLRQKLSILPEEERLYEVENYAVRRGLRRGASTVVFAVAGKEHRQPEGGTVVMPGYARLLEAYRWLQKMEEVLHNPTERPAEEPPRNTDLPF